MDGDWTVQIEDGAHAIHADINALTGKLKITWDGAVLDLSQQWWLLGDLKSFQRNGHSFLLSVHGYGLWGSFVLSMDGVEIPRGGVTAPVKLPGPLAPVQFIKELS